MSEVSVLRDVKLENELPVIPQKVIDKCKKVIVTFYHQKQKFPSVQHISSKMGISKKKVTPILKILSNQGFIEKRGTRYFLLSTDGTDFVTTSKLDKLKAEMKLSPGMLILKGILLIIGIGAVRMSIFHSIGFLETYYSPVKALAAAIIMIIFNIVAADLIVFFYIKRHKALSGVFSVLLVLGTLFSMGSTVIGLYNKTTYSKKQEIIENNKDDLVITKNQQQYNLLLESKDQALKNMELERGKWNKASDKLVPWTPELIEKDPQKYKELNWNVVLAERSFNEANNKYNKLVDEVSLYLKNNTTVKESTNNVPDTAYTWIGNILGISSDSVQFWMSCYPALFYDIIGPVAFCIILFLNNKPKKKVVKRKRGKK